MSNEVVSLRKKTTSLLDSIISLETGFIFIFFFYFFFLPLFLSFSASPSSLSFLVNCATIYKCFFAQWMCSFGSFGLQNFRLGFGTKLIYYIAHQNSFQATKLNCTCQNCLIRRFLMLFLVGNKRYIYNRRR